MDAVSRALGAAVRSLVHPIILGVLLVPMLVALSIWVAVAWAFWGSWTGLIQNFVIEHVSLTWIGQAEFVRLASWIAGTVVLALLAPVVVLTAVLIATVFAMPVLVRHVARLDFAQLEQRHGGTAPGSLWNAVVAIVLFVVLWVVTLPLWLLGPLALPLPLLLSAWLNQRLFRYDALAEHADAPEMTRIFEFARGRLFLLGLATGLVYFIPPFSLIAPVFAALAFIHLCLAELQRLREAERQDSGQGTQDSRTANSVRLLS